MTPDVTEWLEQSSVEAIQAIQATDPEQAAAHQERCLLYTGRAMAALIERRVAFPFQHAA
ncbi:hypothetical protein [Sphingomonas bacterium]|uniref:hypothetical protein n=1 Tax=Sphingomonas bacterium TaxID=1895847 RepID=UPI001577224C|nr:hypothetical protein [Sphingomonas bacterium]